MEEQKPNYLADWFNAVPARWYGMTVILLALVAVGVGAIIWLTDKGLDWWWIASGSIVVLVFMLFSFFAYRKVAIERDAYKLNAGKISSLVNTAMLRLQMYGDERIPTEIAVDNIWRWYYLKTKFLAQTKENGDIQEIAAMTTLFVSFDEPLKVGTLEVHSPDFKLPTYEVKEFNSKFAIIVFSKTLPMGIIELTIRNRN